MPAASSDTGRVGPDPILPAHVEETIRAIAQLHADHDSESGRPSRMVARIIDFIGRPAFAIWLVCVTVLWIVGNLVFSLAGTKAWDPAPFAWLEMACSLLALYATVLILATQRRDDRLATSREQLTLQLAILSEQKLAKIVELVEEIRRDHPHLPDRTDQTAADMSTAADPQAVLAAIKGTEA